MPSPKSPKATSTRPATTPKATSTRPATTPKATSPAVKKATERKDFTTILPYVLYEEIATHLSPKTTQELRMTSTIMRDVVSKKPLEYYHKTNNPKFIKAFKAALYKCRTTQSEHQIKKEYEKEFKEYTKLAHPSTSYDNDYEDTEGIFPKVIHMYLKLLNVTNMKPQYIYDLAHVYYCKLYTVSYNGNKSAKIIDAIIEYELYKIYILMYLYSHDKKPFVHEDVKMSIDKITTILYWGLESIDFKYIIKPIDYKESLLDCYIYILFKILSLKDMRLAEFGFRLKKEYLMENANKSSQTVVINIPPEIGSVKDLLEKYPENYDNCTKHIMTHKSGITKFTPLGEKLDILSGFV